MLENKPDSSLYDVLGLKSTAKDVEIRRAYKNLVSKYHPDKPSGDADQFRAIQEAYAVLGDTTKRQQYDTSGTWERTEEDEFRDTFAGGAFKDKVRAAEQQRQEVLTELVAVRDKESQSHSAGLEAWMRSRGENGTRIYTAEDVIEQFGVVKASYEGVPLPSLEVHTVICSRLGPPKEVLRVEQVLLARELEWGQVLVSMRAAPISPADFFTVQTGVAAYGRKAAELPFVPGTAGVGVVAKLGPGCKTLAEQDWVMPVDATLGTWASLRVVKEKDLLRIPGDCMPLDQLACLREQLTAYCLLEESALKAGDALILNAANSCTGQYVLQLCAVLRLRAVAVVGPEHTEDFEKMQLWLTALGAAQVLLDEGSLKVALEQQRFFAKPKLALDAVGGTSASRLADALPEGGTLVTYGVMSGKSASFHWRNFLFAGLQVRGFNLNRYIKDGRKKIPGVLESLGRLVTAGKLQAVTTEYELATEFAEALDHALERQRNTKVLLKVTEVGERA